MYTLRVRLVLPTIESKGVQEVRRWLPRAGPVDKRSPYTVHDAAGLLEFVQGTNWYKTGLKSGDLECHLIKGYLGCLEGLCEGQTGKQLMEKHYKLANSKLADHPVLAEHLLEPTREQQRMYQMCPIA